MLFLCRLLKCRNTETTKIPRNRSAQKHKLTINRREVFFMIYVKCLNESNSPLKIRPQKCRIDTSLIRIRIKKIPKKSSKEHFYRPQRSCGQGNIFTPVCHAFCSQGGEGVYLSACWNTNPPREQTPPLGADTRHPPDQTPLEQTPPWEQTPWELTPPGADPPDQTPQSRHPPGADTPPEQTPPGSRLQHTVYEWPVRILLECILVSLCGHWFGLLVTSALGFKARIDPSLACFKACVQQNPQIHLRCDTCWPLGG